ncbi:PRMT3 family protein [Megaselia abdita]
MFGCFFCEDIFNSVANAIEHLQCVHSFSLHSIREKFQMNQYDFIKMVNYIRIKEVSAEDLRSVKTQLWSDDKYLKPKTFEPWLTFDFEEIIQLKQTNKTTPEQLVNSLLKELKKKNMLLEQAHNDMELMKASYRRLVEEETNENNGIISISNIPLNVDKSYFNSYDHYGIHHEMLSDKIRTESYRNAFLENINFIKGKSVLDVGCGTAILSMFAYQAGAKEIVSIDNSDIIYNAMDIVRKNNILNIKLIKGRLENTELPIEKFDIIVSEWMGYFLFFEGMLDSVIFARDKYLKPGGTLLPNKCNISLIGHGDVNFHNKYIKFWNDVYGYDMSSMIKEILREPIIEVMDSNCTLTEAVIISEYDLNSVDLTYSNFALNFKMKCIKSGCLTSFVGYFDIFFDLECKVEFSTSPKNTPTHWKQVAFLLDKPVEVKFNDIIEGNIVCRRSKKCARSLDIFITAFNKEYKYFLD